MLVENPVIVGQNYPLKEGTTEHPLRSGMKPGTTVKVLRALGSNLFEVETPEKKTAMVYADNLERGSFHEVAVKFLPEAPTDRTYLKPDQTGADEVETALKELLEQGADVQADCSNTMVQRLAGLLTSKNYEVMAVAKPGSHARHFFRARKA